MLTVRDVRFLASRRPLVDGVSLDLRPGRLVAVVGPNGAGKTTLIRLISGERRPDSGTIALDGRPLAEYTARELARRRAVVPQATHLAFPFTVSEVVLLGRTVPGLSAPSVADREASADALARVGLAGFADRDCTTLSGGERQRVHLARALVQLEPPKPGESGLLILDEPTAGLDLAHQLQVFHEVRKEAARGRAVLAVLHDLNLAARFADNIILMSNGRIARQGRPGEVFDDALLSEVFGCAVKANRLPSDDCPFVLPQTCGLSG